MFQLSEEKITLYLRDVLCMWYSYLWGILSAERKL